MELAGCAVLVVALVAVGLAVRIAVLESQRASADRVLKSVHTFFSERPDHVETLRRIHARTTYADEFGGYVKVKWQRALKDYVKTKLLPVVLPGRTEDSVLTAYTTLADEVLWELWWPVVSIDATDASELEQSCADRLRECGFSAEVTGRTGDQGADVIGRRGNNILIVQCKAQSKPIGNSAVQQAAAALQFYDGTAAIVVGRSGFTASARQLASKLGVSLADERDLARVIRERC